MSELQKNQEIERQPETKKSKIFGIKKQLAALLAAIWIWVSGAVDNVGKVIIPSAYGTEVKTYKQIEDKLKNLQPWHFLIVKLSSNELKELKKDLKDWYEISVLKDGRVKIIRVKEKGNEKDLLSWLDNLSMSDDELKQISWLDKLEKKVSHIERLAIMSPTRSIDLVVWKFEELFKQKKYDEIIKLLKDAYKANSVESSYVDRKEWELYFWKDKQGWVWKNFIEMTEKRLKTVSDKGEKKKLEEILNLLKNIREIVKFKDYDLA